ncbi:uncharacterized protein LOC109008174 isoform X2 [Juglans regia]|uniref:Bifunctional lysine-specific demethylase and histidyl-hydroxylase n=1 Tax=Juglans regia TaxID=51240 RepID=A0A6P9F3C9_JUGRE|nr:uncharacterized protein LOC109008174 isoform X2 [Juglans regia]
MEEKHERKSARRKRKSKPQTFSYQNRSLHLHPQLRHVDADTIFALLLAAISNSHRPDSLSLIEKCLVKLPHSLLSTKPNHILSLLPFLLCSKRASITSRGAEIVGMASLFSLEMNERIAFDADIVKGLVSALASSKRSVLMAACNAVLDMSTTSVARERLLASSALESLMFGFLQVPKSPVMQVSLCTVDDGNATCLKIGFEEDELPILLLTASVILINSCNMEQLEKIPTNLSETFLVLLKKLWAKVHNQMLLANTMRSIQEAHIYPNAQLPRLYDPLDSLPGVEAEVSVAECREILLKEGDILYIPRGFPHEACTDSGGSNGSAGFSLHLTLGIEVEPPFEWEGFAHVALCCWSQTQKQPQFSLLESAVLLDVISVNVLHVAIGLVGDSDPTFRKACLVAAISLSSDTGCWLDLNQRTIFSYLIDKVNTESRFLEALRSIEVAIQKTEDPFHQIRWLRLLNMEGESIEGNDWNVPFVEMAKLFPLCVRHKDQVEAAFMRVKSRFCDEVLFGDVVDSYKMLLDKYRKARKQYMNGMVSLHCTS